jgi:hypothetical protein
VSHALQILSTSHLVNLEMTPSPLAAITFEKHKPGVGHPVGADEGDR